MSVDPQHLDEEAIKRELDHALGEVGAVDMAQLEAAANRKHAAPDDRGRIPGRIIAIRGPDVYVDIGGKSEAFLPLDEFEPDQPPTVGQLLQFIPHGFDRDSGLMRLSLRQVRAEADWASIRVGDVVEGRVTGLNIGGLELAIKGIRAFMPKSQVDVNRVDDFAPFIGHRMECEIVEIDRRHKSVLVSRRRVLERQREEERKQLRTTLAEGQTRKGVVRRIAEFGAFVDIGGIDGLLHISDIAYGRIKHPSDALKVGDEIEVQILKIDADKDRISLGRKQLSADPWSLAEVNYRAGAQVDGRVTKLMPFGAFVELEPGIEGLIPISEMSWTQRVNHPRDILNEGDGVRVSILTIDPATRKLSLSLKALSVDPWTHVAERYAPDTVVSGLVKRTAAFGAFVQLEEGVEGLVHISELSDKHVRNVGEAVKEGQVVQARVLSIDLGQRKISLSIKRAIEAPPEPTPAPGAAAPPPPPAKKRDRPMRGGLTW